MRSISSAARVTALCAALATTWACDAAVTWDRSTGVRQRDVRLDRLAGAVYAERTFLGHPLPYSQSPDNQAALRGWLVADTLSFDGRGTLTNVVVDSFVTAGVPADSGTATNPGPSSVNVERFVATLRYDVAGDTVLGRIDCPPGAACALPPTYIIIGDSLVAEYRAPAYEPPPDQRSLFVRVR